MCITSHSKTIRSYATDCAMIGLSFITTAPFEFDYCLSANYCNRIFSFFKKISQENIREIKFCAYFTLIKAKKNIFLHEIMPE